MNNWGTHGFALCFGPDGTDLGTLPLRIDMDPDVDAAAIRWLSDNLVAVCPDHHGQAIRVLEDSGDPLVSIPAELVRTDIDTAKQAAAEYVEPGQRPKTVA